MNMLTNTFTSKDNNASADADTPLLLATTLLVPPTSLHAYTVIPSLLARCTCAHHCRPELLHSPALAISASQHVRVRTCWAALMEAVCMVILG